MANKSRQKKKTPRKRYNPILALASSYRGCGKRGGFFGKEIKQDAFGKYPWEKSQNDWKELLKPSQTELPYLPSSSGSGKKRKGKLGKGWFNDWLSDIPFVGDTLKSASDAAYNAVVPGKNEYFGDDSTVGKIGKHAMNYMTDELTTPGRFIKRVADSDWSDPSSVAGNVGSALMDEYYMRGKDPLVLATYGNV